MDAVGRVATGRGLEVPIALEGVMKDEYVHSRTLAHALDSIIAIGATFHFTRDKRGRITGFSLSIGRTRGIRFDRVP